MKKILIVEDEFHLRKNIKELLTRHNYEPLAASTLSEAMHYVLNQKDIALFLLDVWLPDGDGFELCSRPQAHNDAGHFSDCLRRRRIRCERIKYWRRRLYYKAVPNG